jgi:hypothetical protein
MVNIYHAMLASWKEGCNLRSFEKPGSSEKPRSSEKPEKLEKLRSNQRTSEKHKIFEQRLTQQTPRHHLSILHTSFSTILA